MKKYEVVYEVVGSENVRVVLRVEACGVNNALLAAAQKLKEVVSTEIVVQVVFVGRVGERTNEL